SRLASRAINLGASAAWRSNTLRFTTIMVSILGAGAWPDRRTGGPAVRSAAIVPTTSPPLRQTALFEQVNSLMQRIAHGAGGGVKVVSRQAHVVAAVRRVDRHPNQRERGVRLHDQAAVPFPAGAALEAQGVVGAGYTIAGEAEQRQQRRAKTSRDGVAQKRRAEA